MLNPALASQFDAFTALLEKAGGLLITAPADTDGDSIAANLGLLWCLDRRFPRLRAEVVNVDPCPERYRFLKGWERILTPSRVQGRSFNLGLVMDGDRFRLGAVEPLYLACDRKGLFDHHGSAKTSDYDFAVLSPGCAATAQMIAHLADHWGLQWDADLAAVLYAGIIYDTGSFRYSLTTPETLRIAARLMETGIDFQKIQERVLLDTTYADTLLRGRVVANAQTAADGKLSWSAVPLSLREEPLLKNADSSGIIPELIFIEGVEVAMLFVEKPNGGVKVSFRSRGLVDVAKAAAELTPRGGGHARAAGCTLQGALPEVIERVRGHIAGKIEAARGKSA
ncbi:MAG: Bifunctional oligoribonuclease and PAP phosphatase NrnA [Myxococcota bacterium]|nr:Bifunctional oligoribonuclease and PAP phosphatase NrnA [Myxococcota bacterium]